MSAATRSHCNKDSIVCLRHSTLRRPRRLDSGRRCAVFGASGALVDYDTFSRHYRPFDIDWLAQLQLEETSESGKPMSAMTAERSEHDV